MIDGFNLSLEKGTGVATYARNLSYCLRDLGYEVGVLYGSSFSERCPDLLKEVLFFDFESESSSRLRRLSRGLGAAWSRRSSTAFRVPLNGAVIAEGFKSRLPHHDSIWNSPNLYVKANRHFEWLGLINRVTPQRKPNVCHWTYPLPLRLPGVPNVYTLHDLVPLRLPYTTLDKKARYLKLLKWICRTAARIVTVSENSKRDIVEILGVDPAKVINTYQAVSIPEELRLKPEDVVLREVEGTFGLEYKEYFLFFGSIEPKKNVGRLIEGYLTSGVKAPLVIVGAQSWKSGPELGLLRAEETRRRLRPNDREGTIVRLEYVPFALLVSLIRGAKAVLFPSLYEGFGLPILESMLLGTPVLTSNKGSMPEVAGDGALLVDPYDSSALAEGIRALDSSSRLRDDLSTLGYRRTLTFSEKAYRQKLGAMYEDLVKSS